MNQQKHNRSTCTISNNNYDVLPFSLTIKFQCVRVGGTRHCLPFVCAPFRWIYWYFVFYAWNRGTITDRKREKQQSDFLWNFLSFFDFFSLSISFFDSLRISSSFSDSALLGSIISQYDFRILPIEEVWDKFKLLVSNTWAVPNMNSDMLNKQNIYTVTVSYINICERKTWDMWQIGIQNPSDNIFCCYFYYYYYMKDLRMINDMPKGYGHAEQRQRHQGRGTMKSEPIRKSKIFSLSMKYWSNFKYFMCYY